MINRPSYRATAFACLLSAAAHFPGAQLGSIHGVVTGIDGKTIPYSQVYAIAENAMNRKPLTTTSDSLGRFSFYGLPDNSYYLDAGKEEEGYIYSPYSFFIMPGQVKPKVKIKESGQVDGVVIKLGTKAAYLDLRIVQKDGKQGPVELTFTRPDFPGYYKRSYDNGGTLPVPAVPFRLTVIGQDHTYWTFHNPKTSNLIRPVPGQHIRLDIIMSDGNQDKP